MTAAAMSLAMAATCMAVEVDHPQIPPRAAGPIMQTLKTTDAPMIPRPEHPRPQFEREAWITPSLQTWSRNRTAYTNTTAHASWT